MKSVFETVCVVGLGYVGLPTAVIIASRGVRVIGVDVSERVVDTLNGGSAHIVEPDLDELVSSVVHAGMLKAFNRPQPADAFMIAVPTPFKDGHKADLRHVEQAALSIAPVLRPGNLVVLESTSPVGATDSVSRWMAGQRPDLTFPHQAGESADIAIAYCPERILPGNVLEELVCNDRLIGGLTRRSAAMASDLYRIFAKGECLSTSARTAELAKLTENAFRDVNIAFANELSAICDRLQIDVWELIDLANRHPRVDILRPGPGVGGHCIAVDPWFIVESAPEESRLIRAAREVNDAKPGRVVEQVARAASDAPGALIACLGLAYKADIDDFRESPAIEVVAELAKLHPKRLLVVEPFARELPPALSGKAQLCTIDHALDQAAIIVLLVDHGQFRAIDRKRLLGKSLIDTRGFFR
jgi:UDP-N-acetyl-D-mannosaminuronic acid dehydrogenase